MNFPKEIIITDKSDYLKKSGRIQRNITKNNLHKCLIFDNTVFF